MSDYGPKTSKLGTYEDCLPEIKKPCEIKEDVHLTDHGNGGRKKVYEKLIPGPKRATLAAQKFQHQRLSKPFRPPSVQKASKNVEREEASSMAVPTSTIPALQSSSLSEKMKERMKDRNAKAAAPFKPPLTLGGWKAGAAVRPTPTIQALERKLQMVKRALKVKENSEEDILCGLIDKWTEAGREIAWELWGIVKENGEFGRKREMEGSWGWEEGGGEGKRQKREEDESEGNTVEGMLKDMGLNVN